MLQPGESFKPYADCRVEAQWTEIITVTANTPVQSGDAFTPNGYTYSGKLAEGDTISLCLLVNQEQGDGFVAVPSERCDHERRGERHRRITSCAMKTATPCTRKNRSREPDPDPSLSRACSETVKITITAKEPVSNDGGKTYEQNGAVLSSGALNDGDSFRRCIARCEAE